MSTMLAGSAECEQSCGAAEALDQPVRRKAELQKAPARVFHGPLPGGCSEEGAQRSRGSRSVGVF